MLKDIKTYIGDRIFYIKEPTYWHWVVLGVKLKKLQGFFWTQILRKIEVMLPTYYYDQPTYAAQRRSLPIGPGATVSIEAEQDIWLRVSLEGFESWVPKFVVRELKTTNQ